MTIAEMQKEILLEKKANDICILAHSYVAREICEIADFTGDSYALSLKAKAAPQKKLLFCGVRFMAETAKILSPEKRVWLSRAEAGCPMAEQMKREDIESFKRENPEYTVVAYINTTAEIKTVSDVCVTSSSAEAIVKKLQSKYIYFIPDCNLGRYIEKKCPDKHFRFFKGGCPVHSAVMPSEAIAAKAMHPNALLLVHPECVPEISDMADFVGATSAIIDFAKKSDRQEFIIGTELSIAEELSFSCPGKRFYPMSKSLICPDMRLTTLPDVYSFIKTGIGEEILLDDRTIALARGCLDAMINA